MDNNLTNLQTANIKITDTVTTSNIGLNDTITFTTSTLTGGVSGNTVTYDIAPSTNIQGEVNGMVGFTLQNTDSANVGAVVGISLADSDGTPMLLWKTNPSYDSATDDLVPGDGVLINVGGGLHIGSATGNIVLYAGGTMAADQIVNIGPDRVVNIDGDIALAGNIDATVNGFEIGYRNMPQVSSGNVTLALGNEGKHYYSTSSAPTTITVPTNANVAFALGTVITVVNQGTGNISVAKGSATLYLGGNATSASRTITTYGVATLLKVATDTWFINGTGVV
jgi:hypothetical protein